MSTIIASIIGFFIGLICGYLMKTALDENKESKGHDAAFSVQEDEPEDEWLQDVLRMVQERGVNIDNGYSEEEPMPQSADDK